MRKKIIRTTATIGISMLLLSVASVYAFFISNDNSAQASTKKQIANIRFESSEVGSLAKELYSQAEENIVETTTEATTEPTTEPTTEATTEATSGSSPTITSTNDTIYSTTSLNVRASNDANSSKIGTLSYGQEANRIGTCDNGWSQIEFDGGVGYVNNSYISTSKPQVQATYSNATSGSNSSSGTGTSAAADPVLAIAQTNASTYSDYINQIVALINQARSENGLAPLSLNSTLTYMAMYRSYEQAQVLNASHTRPDGTTAFTIYSYYGYSCTYKGEVLGQYQESPEEMVNDWLNSPAHREALLSPNFTQIGVGIAEGSNTGLFWTGLFSE